MTDRVHFTIPGRPRPGERAGLRGTRHFRRPNSDAVQSEALAGWTNAGRVRIEGAVAVRVVAVYPRPRSHLRRGGGLSAAGLRSHYPSTVAGDADNICKPVVDGLTVRAFTDDRQVCSLSVEKRWDDGLGPRTEVWVTSLEPPLALDPEPTNEDGRHAGRPSGRYHDVHATR